MMGKKIHRSKINDEEELEKAVRSQNNNEQCVAAPAHAEVPKSIGHLAADGSPRRWRLAAEAAALLREGFDALVGKKALDPGSRFVQIWRRVFLVSCLGGLFVDPLVFYLPQLVRPDGGGGSSSCIGMDRNLRAAVTWLRSAVDLLHALNVAVKFRTAYVAPSSRVFGKGELVGDFRMIERRYARADFSIDLAAAFPLPQIVMWLVTPLTWRSSSLMLTFVVLVQYLLRLYLIHPLSDEIIKAASLIAKSAWGGAAYNLLLYMLASHIIGAIWYLLTVQRQATCWLSQCKLESISSSSKRVPCRPIFLDCRFSQSADYEIWANSTSIFASCDSSNSSITFNYGIFQNSLSYGAPSAVFIEKYFYGLWWGLQQLTSAGQNLTNSPFIGETLFAIVIGMISLILFAQLIGNMQTYLQSTNTKVEEWRLKLRDTEEWMRRRQFPLHLQDRVRRFVQYQWLATRGVDEQSILQGLPFDLRRDIQRHLCLDLVRRVRFFSEMDDQLQDAICERLVSSLCTKGTFVVREGDPVTSMLFVIRGELLSTTTAGGRGDGFCAATVLGPGDFCGEELLTWALMPNAASSLPSSSVTLRALVEVEAFALSAGDVRFVANQFRRFHSRRLQDTLRYYSHQWRTWAACFIQGVWRRRQMRRKRVREWNRWESFSSRSGDEEGSFKSPRSQKQDGHY